MKKRLLGLMFVMMILFSFLIVQFYKIQIVEGEKWKKEAEKQHYFIVKEPFVRGSFFSNTSIKKKHPQSPQPFVVDIEKFHLHIDPKSIPKEFKKEIIIQLSQFLHVSSEQKKEIEKQFFKKSHNRKVALWLDDKQRETILKWWQPFAKQKKIPRNSLFFVSDYQRSYPFGKLLGQVLHSVQSQKEEDTGQAIPTGGLELYFDHYLRGKQGKRRLMRSPRHALETDEIIALPENGADVYLTINHVLQAIAEEELEKGVKSSQAKGGWTVMMDPFTGEILALAQYPFFTPSEYRSYFNDPLLLHDSRIKAVIDSYEPGSVMKPITLAIALMANDELRKQGKPRLFDPEEKIFTGDGRFPGRSKPITDTRYHGYLNMEMAIQKSSNIYMARLVERIVNQLGNEWYRQILQEHFGFGLKTNIEFPSESPGLLPRIGKKHPNGTLEWGTATPFSIAFGHNILVNSLQMLRAHAVIVNGGYLIQPTLIKKIMRSNTGEVIYERKIPDVPKVLNQDIAKQVAKTMKYTTKTGGSGARGDVRGYTEGGKSGTAKKIVNGTYSEKNYLSSFIGFTPAEKPAFLLLVCIDEPHYANLLGASLSHFGGRYAAPVFKEIAEKALSYLGIAPDDPHGYPYGDPRYHKDKGDWFVESRKLQEMYEKWNNKAIAN